mgnify:CR=1 FL=1|tara:strand:+ start:553 stop:1338 length:786 start_codon:yes stop_codon:yes gene_type:complete
MADVTERIEKQMEGTNLALAAVAEVLQKMDDRLAQEEANVLAKEQASASEAAKADLVKSIADQVLSVVKEEMAGLDVSGDTRAAEAVDSGNADDSSQDSDITTDIEEQQNTIQASIKKEEEDEDNEEKGGMAYKQEEEEDDDDEAADVPEEKEMDEDEDDSDEMKSMKKQIANLEKALADSKAESSERLRKMGFREETSLKAPQVAQQPFEGLGVDTTPLVKSDNGDIADQLAELSYKQLRDLQVKIQSGNTDGVPQELLG